MTDNILVLDDDPSSRDSLVRSLKATDLRTIAPKGPFKTMDELRAFASTEGVTHVVTDQRLREKAFSSFLGASAAAALYVMKVAPILVTAYANLDMDSDIRPLLGYIPQVVHRTKVDPITLRHALETSAAEVREGLIPRSRKKFRSVVHVMDIVQRQKNGPPELRLMIRQWRNNETVGFPAGELSDEIRRVLKPGLLLIAQVNIEAETNDKLFLMDFELPPPEDSLDI
jgi:hypothetical protein